MNKLMCHVVAGYPTSKKCIELLLGMQKIGVAAVEVQIPFSDPIADGETIMQANDIALEHKMTIEKSFGLIKEARQRGLKTDVYIMSYVQKLEHLGFATFCERAKSSGAKGLIIPDLPFDAPEFDPLKQVARKNSLVIVPVISPGIETARLEKIIGLSEGMIYLTSMKGTTGRKLQISSELIKLAAKVKKLAPKAKLAVGFGISKKSEVDEILKVADLAVIGSAVIREVDKKGVSGALTLIKKLAA